MPVESTPTRGIPVPLELSELSGKIVSTVRIPSVSPKQEAQLISLLPLAAGQPLTRKLLRDSIARLFQTGRFDTITARAERNTDSVTIIFEAQPSFFIGSLRIIGEPKPPTAPQLINAGKLSLGQPYFQDDFNRGLERMKALLAENGYYQATITPEFVRHLDTQQLDITYRIKPGPHARVGNLFVIGDPGFDVRKVEQVAKMHPRDPVTTARVTRALSRLRKRYQKEKMLEAQVSITAREYHQPSNTVDYTFTIERGERVDIKVEGAHMRRGLIKKYVPVYEENAVDDDLLNEGRRNMRDYFQTKGYFDVALDFSRQQDSAGRSTVVYDVKLGERHKLVRLDISGNKYFDLDTLRERMQIQPASLLQYYGRFSQSLLAADLKSIESLYRANGFNQVKVTSNVVDDYEGKKGQMKVTITIAEGQQTRVAALTFNGVKAFPPDRIEAEISSTEGQPYSDANVAADRDAVTSFYFNRGFPDVKFEAYAEPVAGHPDRVNLRYDINEGRQFFVDRVYISGLHYTRPYVVDREIQIKPGDPLSQAAMVDTQRRLYDLGIFNEADLAIQNPDGLVTQKNVVLQVDEARRYTFNYGFGLEVQTGDVGTNCNGGNTLTSGIGGVSGGPMPGTVVPCAPQGRTGVSPRVSFDVTRLNFLGRNHTILFKSRYGRLQQRALLSYEAPRFFNNPDLRLTFTSFYDKTQDVRTFTAQRLEGSLQLTQQVSKATTMEYRFTYRRVNVDARTLQVSLTLVPLLSRPVRVGLPTVTYIRDTRDDPTDSHRGTYNTADLGVATGAFGSETNFSRLLLQNSTYHQFHKRRWTFARSFRVGVEEPFGATGHDFVPLPERFFAGGGNSHRGFAINQAGPRDLQTGFPLGGSALLLNNLELRTPPIELPFVEENLSAVIFHDMGNVFASSGDMFRSVFRFSQNRLSACKSLTNNAACNFDYVSHAVGAGLRYRTPIGPVRVDVGYDLNPPTFPVTVPTNKQRIETLNRFNLFFSIGQTF